MDVALVVKAQRGDRDAFARLAAESIDRLDRIARLITRDVDMAKDAVQECLVRTWRDLPALREPDRFDSWQRQLVVRSCIDELRRARRRIREVELTDLHHPHVDDAQLSLADRDALARAFKRLDAEQRSLVVMHYYLGMPLTEAADALRVPVGTAKSRLHRAREQMRAALEADARMPQALTGGRA